MGKSWKRTTMIDSSDDDRVAILLSGPAERLVIDAFGHMAQDFPRLDGAGFEQAASRLGNRFPYDQSVIVLRGFAMLLASMQAAGGLPRIRANRPRAGKNELLLVALVAAAQVADKGRAIEAAIALLDSGHVHDVVKAARGLGYRLAENQVLLPMINEATFQYVADYPAVEPVAPRPYIEIVDEEPKRPILRLLESA
jgi:hypothetical protein